MAESEEELKSILMKVKEESEKVGLMLNIQKMKIMASDHIISWEIDGETVETVSDFIFLGSVITADGDCSHEIKRCLLLGRKVITNLDSILKSRDYFANKVHLVKAMVFSSGHVWLWELDCEESCTPKNWCFWTVVLEKTLESPLDCREIQPVYSKGSQSWVFIGRNDAKAETPVLWPPHAKSWLIGKDSDAGRYWGQEEKGSTEDEMAGWLPGASVRNSAHGKGHEEGGSAYAKAGSSLRSSAGILEHLPPKPDSAYFTALCSHLHLWLYRGLSPPPLSEKELTYSSS